MDHLLSIPLLIVIFFVILKPGIAPKPFVPIRYDPGGSTVPARHPRRANATQLRRAYERAREELKTLEREAQPKKRKIN